ncbi:class 1b ribonucleoside-diphosphate reductase subunit alpha [Candidatus Hepatoplasma crinochetorum]|uniref:class 1b ribonucleoside-diphosphate reductase subunit alpha n=1 Tax=Candidatus Hepatoplasma crinochetorum TaxID=295596 RepID=UPI003087201C|nr:MAG: ribonucleoside-diphosphate reductase [Candidatus Hepatoplasma crinochetorum]
MEINYHEHLIDIKLNNQIKLKNKEEDFYQLEKDKIARDIFLANFYKNYQFVKNGYEKVKSLVDLNLYNPIVLKWYSKQDINDLYDFLLSANHLFDSYMAAKKFLNEYTLKSTDKNINYEDYFDRVLILSLYLGRGNYEIAKAIADEIINGRYQPATPTMQDAGRINSGEMISCFLLEMDDNLNSINYILGTSMHLSKIGGGVAVNLSKIRSRGSSLRGIRNITAGIMPILKLLEDSFSFANKLDQRNGAGAAYLNVFHKDVMEFLDTKKINADEKHRIQFLSLGLIVSDKMFNLAKENKIMALFSPHDVKKYYKKDLDDLDINNYYEKLEKDQRISKNYIPARKLLLKIAQTQLESGYPYIMYKDNANKVHPLKEIGQIKMSNLCTEIFQLQETSIINNYEEKDQIKRDVLCNLGSLNIAKIMENKDIEKTVSIAMEALTSVTDLSELKFAPGIDKANKELHAVGLGALNLHGYLAKNRIRYEAREAREFASVFFSAVNFYSIKKSMEIAIREKKQFKDFDKSEYANGNYFKKYFVEDFSPKSEKIKELFKDIKLPTIEDWKELANNVKKYGLYHAYRLAVAPNQSTAYIANATPSVMPITSIIEARTYANSITYYPMPYLKKENILFYKTAYNMDQKKIIDMVATIQEHIDQGVSTILYVDSSISTKELVKYYLYANRKGLKALYYTRTRNLKIEECETCHA